MTRAFEIILVSTLLLCGCGQKGTLFLPTGEAAAARATLPETLNPAASPSGTGPSTTSVPPGSAASAPPTGTASPVRTP